MKHGPLTLTIGCLSMCLCVGEAGIAADEPAGYSLGTFAIDVTIPLGHRCMGILPTKPTVIDDPLEGHGFVLMGSGSPIVFMALDWCEVRNGAYDQWRESLAKAAGTTRERVFLSSLHQHDAPVTDNGAQTYLDAVGMQGELFDTEFQDQCIARACEALREAITDAKPVSHVGIGQAKVRMVASNRRYVKPDGTVTFSRGSNSGGNAALAESSEGTIDPWLKTISFWNGETPLLAIHAYATHPMSYYGRGGVSADFVGMARRQRQREQPRVPQIYVSGCSGDVTAGKYNDGSPEMRPLLAERLRAGMEEAWENTQRHALETVKFRTVLLELPFHEGAEFERSALQKTLRDKNAGDKNRILAAMSLSSLDRVERGEPIDVPCLDLGRAQIVLLPGEAFVSYQLMAQSIRPGSFVMSIGYGECWPGYIPTKTAFDDGFGSNSWRWVGRGSEARVRRALTGVLVAP